MASKRLATVVRTAAVSFAIVAGAALLPDEIRAGLPDPRSRAAPNVRIHPSEVSQTETFIVRHPHDPSILFASANTINLSTGFVSEGIYVSTTGGTTWAGSDTCTGVPITFHRGDPGIAIDKDGRFLLIRLATFPGLYSHYSTDRGATWSNQVTVADADQDRATLASDGDSTSAHYGRSYAVWVKFAPPFAVHFASTDDGAESWSAPAPVNDPPQRCQGGEVAMGPGGSVNACWAGVVDTSPFTEDYAGFARSTDGGETWTVQESAFDMNGIAGVFPTKSNIRVNGLPRIAVDTSGGPRHGWIYIVATERDLAPAGSDPDVVLHRSTTDGTTWSAGIRVNQDGLNNGKFQYFPVVHVDDEGGVNVLYYDDRTTTADSAGVFLSRSSDGGETWEDEEISDHHFRPSPIGGLGQGYQGDTIALTSVGNTLWPLWMDNSSGVYQVWTAGLVEVDPPDTTRVDPAPFALGQNYPNPFRGSTTIEFRLVRGGATRLEIVDVRGRRIATPVDGPRGPGLYLVPFEARGWSGGVYFYRLESDDGVAVKKMVVLGAPED
jgi:hypothetical protein